MTPEQPPSSSRHPRPGVAARRRALGIDAPATPTRESLRDSLARIPDLSPDEPTELIGSKPAVAEPALAGAIASGGGAAPVVETPVDAPPIDRTPGTAPVAPEPAPVIAKPAVVEPEPEPEPAPAAPIAEAPSTPGPEAQVLGPADLLAAEAIATAPAPAARSAGRTKPPMWRRVAFGLVLVGLVAAIPVLGYAGYTLISESKDGNFNGASLTPTDPGYEAQVDPSPTAVAIQYDDAGKPNGLTFMTLGSPTGGGAVIFVPLDTQVVEPSMGVNKLRQSYDLVADRPNAARELLAGQTGKLLNVGVDEIIDLGTAGWSQLVAPVAPLQIDNPNPVDLGYGVVIPEGPTTLTADQVGLYLAAKGADESDLARLERHRVVWEAWLKQVAASGNPDAVPGESTAGIGRFAQALAKGPVSFETLPVTEATDIPNTYQIDKGAVNDLITNVVASPTAAVPGSRFTVRLLNGVSPDAIPSDVVRQVVGHGGAVTILGNGPDFGTDDTTVVYANPAKKNLATLIAKSLGATGTVRLDREAPDTVDLTIVLGKDILGDATGAGEPGATTPNTTAAGGD